jgi:hypothetical protein
MAVYPNDYLIVETFLKGIPDSLQEPIITNGLSLEVNTIDDFVAQAKQYEYAKKTLDYYNCLVAVQHPADTRNHHTNNTKETSSKAKHKPPPETGRDHMSCPVTHPRRGADSKHHTYKPPRETTTPLAIPTSMNIDKAQAILDFTCYNCGEKGHKARDCKKPPQPKVHIRAAHTEDPLRSKYGSSTSRDDHQLEQAEMAHGEDRDEEIVKVEVLED